MSPPGLTACYCLKQPLVDRESPPSKFPARYIPATCHFCIRIRSTNPVHHCICMRVVCITYWITTTAGVFAMGQNEARNPASRLPWASLRVTAFASRSCANCRERRGQAFRRQRGRGDIAGAGTSSSPAKYSVSHVALNGSSSIRHRQLA